MSGTLPGNVSPWSTDNNFATCPTGAFVGQIAEVFGNDLIMVKLAGADAATAGQLGFQHTNGTLGNVSVTAATIVDGTVGTIADPVCMFIVACTAGQFAWALRRGWTTADGKPDGTAILQTDGGVVAGDFLVADGGASPDGVTDTMAAGEEHAKFGCAPAADTAGNKLACYATFNG